MQVFTSLTDAANSYQATGAVILDVRNAFDKVWHEGLPNKLALSPIPPTIVRLIRSYLTDRTFRISVDGALSREQYGEIQGYLLYA